MPTITRHGSQRAHALLADAGRCLHEISPGLPEQVATTAAMRPRPARHDWLLYGLADGPATR